MMVLKLPSETSALVEQYFHIRIGPFEIECPYFKNVRGLKGLRSVYAGKGLPGEIESEAAKIYLANRGDIVNSRRAQEVMQMAGIGIDCSGFVVNILNQLSNETNGSPLWIGWRFNGLPHRLLLSYLRPRENISASDLTEDKNSFVIDWDDLRPGDLVGTGGRHVILVERVETYGGKVVKVGYVESNSFPKFGVQRGEIVPGAKLRSYPILGPRRLRMFVKMKGRVK